MKDLSFLTKYKIAHRGLHNDIFPENSIGAFKQAILKKYIIELDIHLTKDKRVVVFHDDTLKRMTGKSGFIKDYTYQELLKLNLKGTNYKIPLLEEVLILVDKKVPIIIELKYDQRVGLLEKKVIKILDKYDGDFAVKSFSFLSVFYFFIHRKNYIRGLLLKNNTYLFTRLFTRPDFLSYNVKNLPNKKINKIKRRKLILGWTVKTKEQFNKIKDYCDNYICEDFIK